MNIRLVASRFAVLLVVLLAMVTEHAWKEHGVADTLLETIGYVLLLVGCIGRIWCAVYISGRKDRELVIDGPFSMMRNPLYFFSLIALIGVGLSFESLILTLAFATIFFLTHWRTIILEERQLLVIFGESYSEYRGRVPRFIPKITLYHPAKQLTISAKTFTRAMFEASLIPLAFLGAQAIELAHEHGVLPTFVRLY